MFDDRADAGRRLVPAIRSLSLHDPIVLAMPRGGVPVALPISQALEAPLDVIVVRKLGVPHQPELAMGAIGPGVQVLDERVIEQARVNRHDIDTATAREQKELARREREYRGDAPWPNLAGRSVVLVDDGIATGSTALAAIQVLRARGAGRIVLAVPVLPPSAVRRFDGLVEDLVYIESPRDFQAVGQYYVHFGQTTDDEVRKALHQEATH